LINTKNGRNGGTEKNYTKIIGINIIISINAVKINVFNILIKRQKLSVYKKARPIMCRLYELHNKYKDTNR
jgi:hypothetical protein